MGDKGSSSESLLNSEKDELLPSRSKYSSTRSAWTFWLVYTTAVVVLGSSFQFGFGTTCMNAPEKNIKDYFRKYGTFTELMWSTAVAIFAVGGMFGSVIGQIIANFLGSKRTLLLNNIPAIIGSLMIFSSYYAKGPALLIIGRLIFGFNNGINTAVAPVYLSEIAPIRIRGALGVLNQFGIVTGMLVGYILGLKEVLGTDTGWPYLLGFGFLVAILQLFTLPFCPRSPRYLLLKLNKEPETVEALIKLRGTSDVSEDIEEMRGEQENHLREEKVSVLRLVQIKELRKPLVISVVLQLAQQFSGINAVFYYSTSIFASAGVKEGRVASVFVGVTSLVMTAVTVKVVEVMGRRSLLLFGQAGMFVFYAVMTISFRFEDLSGMNYVSVVATLLTVTFFQLGPGPIPWFITAELFSQGPRPAAVAIAGVVNWLANFIVGLVFPSMQAALTPYTFLVFMVLVAFFFVFTLIYVPETKGRTIEQITSHFKADSEEPNGVHVVYERDHNN